MKYFAVAHMDFFDNDLKIEFVYANTWKEAFNIAFPLGDYELPDDIEEAKTEAFNGDWMFEVTEVPGKIA